MSASRLRASASSTARARRAGLLVALVAAGCSVHDRTRADASVPDLGGSYDDAGQWTGPCDEASHPCAAGQRCLAQACIPDHGTCHSDNDCQDDTYCTCTGGGGGDAGACLGGICVPWGTGDHGVFDPDCATPTFLPAQFQAPKLKCSFSPDFNAGSLVVPLVADLNGDGKAEVIFQRYLRGFAAIHGDTCQLYFDKPFEFAGDGQSQMAVADLDGDHVPEIIGLDSTGHVVVFDNHGNLLATSPTPLPNRVNWDGVAVADVDGKAPPEVIAGGQVSRYAAGKINVLYTNAPPVPIGGTLPIVADLDGDGHSELVAGPVVYDAATGKDRTPPGLSAIAAAGGGFPALGDFNGDGDADIVLVQPGLNAPGQVSIYDFAHDKVLFGPYPLPSWGGGPPTVADFDGDGKPEFATAGPDHYYVFSLRCDSRFPPRQCEQTTHIGILWSKVTQDVTSGITGSSVFDFNGDGIAEVVYRDECWLRVYNGPDGRTLFATTVSSATGLELPVIADVDSDGHADIVVCADDLNRQCDNEPDEVDTHQKWTGYTHGIFIFQDPLNRWMPSRRLWNQHAYHITNVNDDLSVPEVEAPNHHSFNNYRQNVERLMGPGGAVLPDYTAGVGTGVDPGSTDCTAAWTLRAQVCNRGTGVIDAGAPGTFYLADPRAGSVPPVCTARTTLPLGPGQCLPVSCDWATPVDPEKGTDLWFRANDDGGGTVPSPECKKGNDLLFIPRATCSRPG